MRERKKEMAATGNKPLSLPQLTNIDERVLSIIGAEYVEGSSQCLENVPEEDVGLNAFKTIIF